MRREAAARLPRGTILTFGDNQVASRCSFVLRGRVLAATPRGGLLVQPLSDDGEPGKSRWIGFHHVIYVHPPEQKPMGVEGENDPLFR